MKCRRHLPDAERSGGADNRAGETVELVRERCFLTEAGRLFLELLLLAEWDPDLKKYEGIRADELFRMWKERKTEKNVPKDWKSAERGTVSRRRTGRER